MNYSIDKTLRLLLFVFFVNINCLVHAKITITKFTPYSTCTASYPTAYTTGSFAIVESRINGQQGFKKNQNNKVLTLGFTNTSFQFLAGSGTVTSSDAELTVNGYTITSTQIIVNLSTSSQNQSFTSLNFLGIQVRAATSGTTFIARTGGTQTFLIDNSASIPSNITSLGDFSAGLPFAVLSNTTTQGPTSSVFLNTVDNEILSVAITVTGNCSTLLNATSFTFNTAGSGLATQNPSSNLSNATLYYTGQSAVFASNVVFGNISSPNGSFVISGSNTFSTAGTYYFWLTYDIKSTAIGGNIVDAQFNGVNISSTSYSASSGNPSGTRTINNSVYYSLDASNWSNNTTKWSLTSGGAPCSCVPSASSAVFISHATLLDINSPNISQVVISAGGNLTDNTKTLTCSNALITSGSGYFQATGRWSLNDVTVGGTITSTSAETFSLTGDLVVGSGCTLQLTGGTGKDLAVNGNLSVNGALLLGTSNASCSNIAGLFVTGTGTVGGSGTFNFGVTKEITLGSSLTFSTAVAVGSGVIMNNNGSITIENNLVGASSTSRWNNLASSTLNIGGTTGSLLSTGILDATYSGNVVNYKGSGLQTVKTPTTSTYYNLSLSNAGAKNVIASLNVTGDVNISGNAQFSLTSNPITLNGNWINNSSNSSALVSSGNVLINGLSTITGTGLTTFFTFSITNSGSVTSNPITGKVAFASNFVNEGEFDALTSDVTFNGSSLISGNTITEFYSIIVNASKALTLHAVETDVAGDITLNGSITHNNGLLMFTGPGIPQTLSGTAASISLYQMEIDNAGGSLTTSIPITITNSLTLTNGIIFTSSTSVLSLASSAACNSGSSANYVDGPMARTGSSAFVFPIGKNGIYARIGVGAMSAANTFQAEYFTSGYTNTITMASSPTPTLGRISKVEYWILDRTAGSAAANVTLYWENAFYSGINDCSTADLRVARFNGTAWENTSETVVTTGSCSGATPGSISTTTGVSNFSPFTFGSKSTNTLNPLPIYLSDFHAACIGDGTIEITWVSLTELKVDSYILQKSIDAQHWVDVKRTPVSKDSYEKRTYKAYDFSESNAVTYYRLGILNSDGSVSFESTIFSNCAASKFADVKVSPNPSCGNLSVEIYNSSFSQNASITMVDNLGRVLMEKQLYLENGYNQLTLQGDYKPGVYTLKINGVDLVSKSVNVVILNCN